MNINCIICADLFTPSSEIYTTRCGHLFHYVCLITWLERSKSCPQCRQKSNEKSINRVYFNFPNNDGVEEDAVSLQNKLDAIKLNLRLKEAEIKDLSDKYKQSNENNEKLANQLSGYKSEVERLKSGIGAIKEQLVYSKVKLKEQEKLEEELKALKEKVENLQHINKGITGSYEEAQDVARNCEDTKTLAQVMLSLKHELHEVMKKKELMFLKVKKAERELHCNKKELEALQKINNSLSYTSKIHEKCGPEKKALKSKIQELTEMLSGEKPANPQVLKVTIDNVSSPELKTKQFELKKNFEIIDSPDVSSRAKQIKDSESPYLQLKQNPMGILLQTHGLSSRMGNGNTSIFKSKRTEPEAQPKKMPEHIVHDGMGGHDRVDYFSNRSAFQQSLKRQRFTTTLPSKKPRNVSKQQNKIDDYINISQLE